jgi:hypothetical protein
MVETVAGLPLELVVAMDDELDPNVCVLDQTCLLNDDGELVLAYHAWSSDETDAWGDKYRMYRVKLGARKLVPLARLDVKAFFSGNNHSLLVSSVVSQSVTANIFSFYFFFITAVRPGRRHRFSFVPPPLGPPPSALPMSRRRFDGVGIHLSQLSLIDRDCIRVTVSSSRVLWYGRFVFSFSSPGTVMRKGGLYLSMAVSMKEVAASTMSTTFVETWKNWFPDGDTKAGIVLSLWNNFLRTPLRFVMARSNHGERLVRISLSSELGR